MKRILIVDDDADLLISLKRILTKKGYDIVASANGLETIYLTRYFTPDLILLDVMLGDADGKEICHQLKVDKKTSEIPVIMISAHASVKEIKDSCEADAFIDKPFNLPVLYSKIEALTA